MSAADRTGTTASAVPRIRILMTEGLVSHDRSPRAARRERELADRRRDVVAAATVVFADKGFHDAQMAEIAGTAEVSLASLYALFEGKEALVQEVLRNAAELMDGTVRSRVEEALGAEERILAFVDAMFECFEENRALLRILLAGTRGLPWRVRQTMGAPADALLAGFYDWVRSLCGELARERGLGAVDPEALAATLLGGITNLAAATMEREPESSLAPAAAELRSLFVRLLKGAAA